MTRAVWDASARTFATADGTALSYREVGEGRPVVLLHGYLTTADDAWVRPGIADALATGGRRVVMPNLRGHGAGAWSHDAADYPADALTDDGLELIEHLGVSDYDLVGYSVGGRVVARMLVRGARPGRAIIAGTGLEPIVHAAGRGDGYRRMLAAIVAEDSEDGTADGVDAGAEGAGSGTSTGGADADPTDWDLGIYLRSIGADPVALTRILDTFVDTPLADLQALHTPTLVVAGVDEDRGSVEELAAALPRAELRRIPGNHRSASQAPEFTEAILEFLRA
jgi:pimeloyl-ACP methyl ester carboxylesterase